ncbi:acyltransferase [Virgibacillus halodenitrificans]|uniref:acyltransferase n=1 Tax=Virgibacillus halodenitrificans TaxID=1482 RepID=UPI0013CF31C2|nr:acyltransferase [Virgibacillus halodenitrificans]
MKRNLYLDFLKGVAIISVFVIHVNALTFDEENLTIFSLYFDSFSRFAVPFFFGVLGYMTVTRYIYTENWKDFFQRKGMLIAIPYLLWSLLYFFVPTVYPFLEEGHGKQNSWDVLLGYSEVHLYFMIPYLTFLIFTPAVVKAIKKFQKQTISRIAIIITALHVLLLISVESDVLSGNHTWYHETGYLLIVHWISFYSIGLFIGINKYAVLSLVNRDKWERKRSVLLAGVLYFISVSIYVFTFKVLFPYATPHLVLNALIALWGFSVFYHYFRYSKGMRYITLLGGNTFPFYLSHILFIKIGYFIFCSEGITPMNLILVSISGFALSLLYVLLHNKIVKAIKNNVYLLNNEKSYICFRRR